MQQDIHTDIELVKKIQLCWNPVLRRSGKLIQRLDGVWHYGVALSDTSTISWGPNEAGKFYHQGWNCEHWARLVVSGQPISYQVKNQGFGMFDLFGVLYFRGEAIEHLEKYKITS